MIKYVKYEYTKKEKTLLKINKEDLKNEKYILFMLSWKTVLLKYQFYPDCPTDSES